ncbi:MAG: ELM1/GtrOC1 family putative glycosyltransferase [Burkholderiales bacterium]|nr:ELM1/GtrOC1 family putative glycosyltransferase [Burkholderiales bacterium]
MPVPHRADQRPLQLWRLTDGRPGHEKQSLGLAQALARRSALQCLDLPVRGTAATGLWSWLSGRFPAGAALPRPDLILAAGHATHLPALAARRAHGGRIVVLMRPSLPLLLFDLCLIPAHDDPPRRANVIPTRGVLNAVASGGVHDPARGLILVGGPSRHYRWDGARVAAQVRAILQAQPQVAYTLTTSRRTPDDFLAVLGAPAELDIRPHETTPAGWIEAELAACGQAWVTPDSGSMVYEALTAGCRVGLLELPPVRGSRLAEDMAALVREGRVAPWSHFLHTGTLPAPDEGFNEAERCARAIIERWYA